MIKRYIITITGSVQGVGYRSFTASAAVELGIRGNVHNNIDGSVQVIIETEETTYQSLLTKLMKGPPFSKVDKLDCRVEEASGEFHYILTRTP
ncbi:acylphosphatase [Peribacillus psychrosaccharolyticus]|uniref:acylphosphatase n=1 Tax=Peribacillus psychrosaccharolyticus TaxID=1407 RepID=A0A974S2A3_PERPY|nr:acylphosphatase [Peribacillus psychrosaccharolyticus]MEC2057082.1 acylphosphatase [Peribacillus psychrosaccharolyticus]MED3745004.1 acylphosphatase [Peribacillus psychrosaccharolyticus]QQT02381.1 acylphosphatase [Peribacillus psychrosaccharolyticus]